MKLKISEDRVKHFYSGNSPESKRKEIAELHEGDYELFSEPEYIGPYGDDGWETDDDDYYNFKQLGLRTVHDVVDFYKDLSKRQIVARHGAYGVLADIDWNVRHGYWDDRNTQAVIDALDSDPSFKFYGESLKRNKSKRLREQNDEEFSYRIDYYGSWDNGRVLHSFKKATLDRAEEDAKKASLNDPKNLYYVVLDDIMNPATGWKWYQGKRYWYEDPALDRIKREINNRR